MTPPPPPDPPRAPRWPAALLLGAGVLALHGLVLGLLPPGAAAPGPAPARRAIAVRQIVGPARAPVAEPAPAPGGAVAPAVRPVPRLERPRPRPRPRPAAAEVAALPPAAAADAEPPPVAVPVALTDAIAPVAASAPAPTAPEAGTPPPVYATRLPPPARLDYELRRGLLSGSGTLDWRPAGARYSAALEGRAFGVPFLQWSSEGGIDAAGIAPERYVDRRRGRGAQAANVQRDRGRITFSGPATEYPVVPGLQDRLSWMIQVPAIVEAAPPRFGPGTRITMFVVGARGDGDVWTFEVEAVEALDLPAGRVEGALHLHRAPRKPYDTQVDAWLDPARHHLPVKVRLAVPQSGDATEFLLSEALMR